MRSLPSLVWAPIAPSVALSMPRLAEGVTAGESMIDMPYTCKVSSEGDCGEVDSACERCKCSKRTYLCLNNSRRV